MENETILTLRDMAWQRAKGELQAMMATYWPEYGPGGQRINSNNFDEQSVLVEKFINDMEGYR